MVKRRRKPSRLGQIVGLLVLATSAGVAVAAGILLGLKFVNIGTALFGMVLPAAALGVIGAAICLLARTESRAYRVPPAHTRLDIMRASHGPKPPTVMGRCAVPSNQAPAGRWEP